MNRRFCRLSELCGLLSVAVLLAACASGPTVVTNKDPDADFANFRTFNFMQPLATDRGDTRTIMSTHLIAAATSEMETLGFQRADNDPDLLVNFFVSTQERLQTRTTPNVRASTHHRSRRYGTWRGYSMSASTTTITQTTEGTIAVDVVEVARNQLVWEGAASGRVTDSTRQNLEETVNSAVADIFAKFP